VSTHDEDGVAGVGVVPVVSAAAPVTESEAQPNR